MALFDVLFWVGCAGSTDPAAIRTTKSVAKLLNKAGVKYACLGDEEACTGDPARRTGEEFLFQERAMENVSVFERYGVKRVVTACPHCFNTLKNEYGDFGAQMQVFHHTQFLQELVLDGKLISANAASSNVVFHDPCYLGRYEGVYDPPRDLIRSAGHELVELPRNRRKSFCCGGGAAGFASDTEIDGRRVDQERSDEIKASGAEVLVTGCPECKMMLGTAAAETKDLAELVAESLA